MRRLELGQYIGVHFGRLIVQGAERVPTNGRTVLYFLCVCKCGSLTRIAAQSVLSGVTQSCGCLHSEVAARSCVERTIHGHTIAHRRSGEWIAWNEMIARCSNPRHKAFGRYGGRGIAVCDRWRTFENFLQDVGLKPHASLTLDRINNDGNYEPGNVRWADKITQANNTRANRHITYHGITRTLAQWSAVLAIPYNVLCARVITRGMSPDRAFSMSYTPNRVREGGKG